MNSPTGEITIIVVMLIALTLNVACHNDQQVRESPIRDAARRLTIIAQSILIARLAWSFWDAQESCCSSPMFFVFLLWGLGSIMGNLDGLARRWGREISDLLRPGVQYERRSSHRESH